MAQPGHSYAGVRTIALLWVVGFNLPEAASHLGDDDNAAWEWGKAGRGSGLQGGAALCSAPSSHQRLRTSVPTACRGSRRRPPALGPGVESRITNHSESLTLVRYSLRWHPCQRRAALTPRARFCSYTASRRCDSHEQQCLGQHPALTFRPTSHSSKSAKGFPLVQASHSRCRGCGYSVSLPVMTHSRLLTPTGFRLSQVRSYRTNTTNASSSCGITDGTAVSPPARSAQAGFLGPRIP